MFILASFKFIFGDFHNVWGVFGGLGAPNRKFFILGVEAKNIEVTHEVVYPGASNAKLFILGVEAKHRKRTVPHAYDLEHDQAPERYLSQSSQHVFIVEQIPTWFEATLLIISVRSLSFHLQCRSLRKKRK